MAALTFVNFLHQLNWLPALKRDTVAVMEREPHSIAAGETICAIVAMLSYALAYYSHPYSL